MKYDRSKSDQLTQRRRDQIIEAAERSFRKRGFHATTLREIAAEFGMSVGHIYNYFSGKDAILEALIHRKIDDFLSLLTKGNPNDTVRDRLRRVVNSYIDPEVAPIVLAVNSEALINESVLRILKASPNTSWIWSARMATAANGRRNTPNSFATASSRRSPCSRGCTLPFFSTMWTPTCSARS